MSTIVWLCSNVPLDMNNDHTLYFKDATTQFNYFINNYLFNEYRNLTYQRKDNIIRIHEHYDDICSCNYVIYKNDHENKYYYAFIKNMTYKNEDMTEVEIETDVIQTYLFNYQVGTSFIEREHVNDDSIGKNTIPETLQMGEYVCNGYEKDSNLDVSDRVVIGTTTTAYHNSSGFHDEDWMGGIYTGIYSGVRYYIRYASSDSADEGLPSANLTSYLQFLADENKIDSVSSLFLAPEFLIQGSDITKDGKTFHGAITETNTPRTYEKITAKQNTINGYTPRNKKLLTYPFQYLLVDNGCGSAVEYQYELFADEESCEFLVRGVLTPGCSIRMIPKNYKGRELNEIEGINLGKYPQCNWSTDQYTNWLTQNGVSIGIQSASSLASIVGGAIMLGSGGGAPAGVGMIASGVIGVSSSVNEVYQASRIPPQTSGNVNAGDVVTASKNNTFHFYKMSIREEYAQIIDSYFDMYGYKVNRLGVPLYNHRDKYWFTKTIDANIIGNVPEKDKQKIRECYNKGITFWRPGYFREYGLNRIMSV